MSRRSLAHAWSREYGVDVKESLYHYAGYWYRHPSQFPVALWDSHGYIVVPTQEDYRSSPYLMRGKQLGVPNGGISSIPGYQRVR